MNCFVKALRTGSFVLAFVTVCPFSLAQSVIWNGELDDEDSQFNRTNESGDIMSFVGTNVYFDAQPFYVLTDGRYTLESGQPEGWDGMVFVYSPSFDPRSPLKNWSFGNDGYVGPFSVLPGSSQDLEHGSRVADMTLKSNVQYYAVTTSFWNYCEGDYTNGIGNGPGIVRLGIVPEPVTAMPLALGLVALSRRRRR